MARGKMPSVSMSTMDTNLCITGSNYTTSWETLSYGMDFECGALFAWYVKSAACSALIKLKEQK